MNSISPKYQKITATMKKIVMWTVSKFERSIYVLNDHICVKSSDN